MSKIYRLNPQLDCVNDTPDWKGTPIDEKGRFLNLYEPFENNFWKLLKWQFSRNPQIKEKKKDKRRLLSHINNEVFSSNEDMIVWLGHASFLIRLGEKILLTDPIFFDSFFLKRNVDLPFDLTSIPKIDYILLSHDHRDHCDKKTLNFIGRLNPDIKILTGLEMPKLLKKWLPETDIIEAGWYQKYNLDEFFEIIFVPSRHWSKRGLRDDRKRLWGGFFIKYKGTNIYFMGDSGYSRNFKEINDVCGKADYAMMGIGAYKPEWFMYSAHMNPHDAVKAFCDLEGRYFIPMHYGTFDLSDELLLEPIDVIKNENLTNLLDLKVGEILKLKI